MTPPLGNFSASFSRSLSCTFSTSDINVFKYSEAFPAITLAWHKRLSNDVAFFFSYKGKNTTSN
jgi:ABC-type phosphate/phosphonate transport system substrate-binding protein